MKFLALSKPGGSAVTQESRKAPDFKNTWALWLVLPWLAFAATLARAEQISISLFGNPCLLKGPFPKTTLESIHSISPEQIPWIQNEEQAREAQQRVKSVGSIPQALDSYKEKLSKRLDAQKAFFVALGAAQHAKSPSPLSELGKTTLGREGKKRFEAAIKENVPAGFAKPLTQETSEGLSEAWNELIEPFPEEQFHRTIQKLGIQYSCSFDEGQ